MTFNEVIIALKEGKKARRAVWNNQGYLVISNGAFYHSFNGKQAILYLEDVLAEDWELFND
jgi:hypothetical protein